MNNTAWERVPLGELSQEITVGHVGTMANEYVDHGIPFLRSLNILPYRITLDQVKFIRPEFHERLKKSTLAPGDVLIVRTGKPGTCAVVPESLPLSNCSDLVIVRPGSRLNSRFLAYYVNGVAMNHVSAHLVGAVQQHFNVESARQMTILLPSLRDQERIVSILGSLDDKIDLNRRMNETLEAMARRLFKSWFIDFDPVHAKAALRRENPKLSNADISRRALPNMAPEIAELFPDSFEESTLGRIPKGWKTRALYDTARYVNGAAFKNSDFCDPREGKPVIKIAELKSGIDSQTKFSQKDVGPDRTIRCGDTLYSWSGSPDTSLATFRWTGCEGLLNQHIFKVITQTRPDEMFAYYQLNELRDTLIGIARNKQTTGLGHVTVEDMKSLQCIQPVAEVIHAFSLLNGSIYDHSFTLLVDSVTLKTTREKLLPSLLCGDLNVKG